MKFWHMSTPVCSTEAGLRTDFCQMVMLEIQHSISACSQWMQCCPVYFDLGWGSPRCHNAIAQRGEIPTSTLCWCRDLSGSFSTCWFTMRVYPALVFYRVLDLGFYLLMTVVGAYCTRVGTQRDHLLVSPKAGYGCHLLKARRSRSTAA